ncbi:hypothetical protein [Microbacterium aquilitoris]|uniref:Uncharacterized protein n=1 Tax=Microbacterium aquilitoris TaxID=3067307 RepID=A0ABU3GH83_9MICO|nr:MULTISPECIES: hypothetical protein [unclassified Microbacterium]MDT3329236.1 hypothetical protein [Microbacterium sp. KSW-18]MDT3345077.1 hypothetical protein [Microbacterium sp. KSW2-22]
MPYRSRETLQLWLDEFVAARQDGDLIKVVIQDDSWGDDGGLVVVPLRNASTTVYVRPPMNDDARWRVVFEPQLDEVALSAEETAALVAELGTAADLCGYLEVRSVAHIEASPTA